MIDNKIKTIDISLVKPNIRTTKSIIWGITIMISTNSIIATQVTLTNSWISRANRIPHKDMTNNNNITNKITKDLNG